MNAPFIFRFLKDLSANNNREWFNEHREEYETARNEFDKLLEAVIGRLSLFDETIRGIGRKTVRTVFTATHASLPIKPLTRIISAATSMRKARNPIIAVIIYICSPAGVCSREEATACPRMC